MTRNGIYLYGYYGQGNLGDDLLLTSALQMIRTVRPDTPVFVHCHDPARLPELNDPRIVPVPANARLADAALSRPARLRAYFADLRKAFKQSDTLVFGGGTVFQDAVSPVSLLIIAATVMLATHMGLKVIAIGSGVGKLRTTTGRIAMKVILSRADIFCVRDEASLAICRAIAPSANLRQTADLVYRLAAPPVLLGQRDGIVLSIQPSVTRREDEQGQRARDVLRTVIETAVQRGESCALLAFETKQSGHGGADDRDAWDDIAGDLLVAHPERVRSRALAGSIEDVIRTIAGARAHYGMRYHGHVLAAVAGTPFAGLAHGVKVEAVCQSFGMPCADVANASPESAMRDIEAATRLAVPDAVLQALRASAERNIDALHDVLGGPA
jgi:polysaccharide pyruvyl transferase WcaK-like protein